MLWLAQAAGRNNRRNVAAGRWSKHRMLRLTAGRPQSHTVLAPRLMHTVDGPVALPAGIYVVGVRDRGLEPGQRHGRAYTVTAYMRDTATVIESISRYDEYGTDSQRFRFRNRFQPRTVSALVHDVLTEK